MSMEIKQHLKLSQQLVMTPQLQQAIKLLQMSRMELVDMVRDELLENPILEDSMDQGEAAAADAGAIAERSELNTIDQQVSADDRAHDAQSKESEKKADEIDWERYLENHAMQAPMPSFRGGMDEELPGFESTLTR